MNDISISMQHLTKSYKRQVLRDVSIEITNESFYSICGESGAGKSTFMNILGLIEDYDEGTYIFNGTEIKQGKDYSSLRLNNIGFIFQSYNLILNMTSRENILLPLRYAKKSCDVARQYQSLTKRLGIDDILEQKVNVLSGGEKQRVAIARALLLNPCLIIADEPTGNLDVKNRDIIINLLKEEHKNGRGVVIITHDMALANKTEKKFMLENGCLYETKKN